jgi:hypothetical protein
LNFEALNLWLVVVDFWRKDHSLLLVLQKVMRESGPEESSINVYRSKFGDVNFFAPWAINLKPRNL